MKTFISSLSAAFILGAAPAIAHFGIILPSDNMIGSEEGREVALEYGFFHPFEQEGMVLVPPAAAEVHVGDTTEDLTDSLNPVQIWGSDGFETTYSFTAPGVHVFTMTPEPYWEPAEDAFIIHYTKTYVSAFDDDEGWDAEIGLPTEIVPLTRPFGLWAGNLFQGIVKRDGEPVPYAEVEVEFFNTPGVTAPSELMITQTVKADGNGVFSYAAPGAGWFGFAALGTADYTLDQDGVAKDVEIGAVIWVKFEAFE